MDKLLSVIFMVGVLLLVLPRFFTIKFSIKAIFKNLKYLDYYSSYNLSDYLFI